MITHTPSRIVVHPNLWQPRLFAAGLKADAQAHQQTFGDLPRLTPQQLLAEIQASGLDGPGGAGFSAYRKLASTTAKATVIINAAEGEYLSYKDRVLLEHAMHLVFDGAQLAARIVATCRIVLYARAETIDRVGKLAQERGIDLVLAPGTFIAGEATAAANAVLNGRPVPMDRTQRLNTSEKTGRFLSGKRGPILVHNAETLAHLALIARYGAEHFRATGGAGTRLFTVYERRTSGDIAHLVEAPDRTCLDTLYRRLGLSLDSAPCCSHRRPSRTLGYTRGLHPAAW